MLVVVVLSLLVGLAVVIGSGPPVLRDVQTVRELFSSKQAFAIAESGEEDIAYRARRGMLYSPQTVLTIGSFVATTSVGVNMTAVELTQIRATGTAGILSNIYRKKSLDMIHGSNVTFNYGVQAGNGGFFLYNSGSVQGNIFSNGVVTGTGAGMLPGGNLIQGSIVSAGASGSVSGVYATSSVTSHNIINSKIDGEAYYQTIFNSTVGGSSCPNSFCHPGSPDPLPQDFPISDATIDTWEGLAEAGGVIPCVGLPPKYVISTNTTLGPTKINCDLQIHDANIKLAGPVWVNGSIEILQNSTIQTDLSLGSKSTYMIADKKTPFIDRTNSSQIFVRNSTNFPYGGPNTGYVMMIARNRSAEDGGLAVAIDLTQSASGEIIFYTNHGSIEIGNNSSVRELTGYKIIVKNSAVVIYKTGLANAFFETGPGGSWNFYDWHERQ